jgi:hypothetical protein
MTVVLSVVGARSLVAGRIRAAALAFRHVAALYGRATQQEDVSGFV